MEPPTGTLQASPWPGASLQRPGSLPSKLLEISLGALARNRWAPSAAERGAGSTRSSTYSIRSIRSTQVLVIIVVLIVIVVLVVLVVLAALAVLLVY